MGYHVVVLEPHAPSPAGEVSSAQIAEGYSSEKGLDELASRVLAVTTEFENVPAESLKRLADAGVITAPHADAVAATQDRNVEKAFIESAGVPTAPHKAVRTLDDVNALEDSLFPGILKTARLGYDGKGQASAPARKRSPPGKNSAAPNASLKSALISRRKSRSSSAAIRRAKPSSSPSAKTITETASSPTP